MAGHGERLAIGQGDVGYSYQNLMRAVDAADAQLDQNGIRFGDVIGLQSDFALPAIALALALFRKGCIVAFLSPNANAITMLADACAEGYFAAHDGERLAYNPLPREGTHALLDQLRDQQKPGFIIFSSGSSGRPKAILHDLDGFLAVYDRPTKALTTLAFLLFDHIAGVDTLLYTLHAGGTLVIIDDRSPANGLRCHCTLAGSGPAGLAILPEAHVPERRRRSR